MATRRSWGFLILWAVSLLGALLIYGQQQLSEFDPDGLLQYQSSSPDFDQKLTNILLERNVLPGSIVHIGSTHNCYCETLVAPHQTQLINKLKSATYNLVKLNIEEIPGLQQLLSAVPALIVIDNNNQLRYVGPYATGYGCFTGKNLVAQVTGYVRHSPYHGAVVNTDAVGCFC